VFEDLLRTWDGEEAVIRFDEPSGAWMFVCIHSTALGPAGGGTRMRVYDRPADGLADAMRLSQAMTAKMACANADRGGGKGVLAVPALPGANFIDFDRHSEVFEAAYQWCRGRIDELDKQGSPALAAILATKN